MKPGPALPIAWEKLRLVGAMIRSVHIEPLKKVSVRVFTFGEHDGDPNVGREYELVFAKVAGFRLMSLHLPARVQAHSLVADSPFIDEVRNNSDHGSARIDMLGLQHWQLVADSGQIDIASEMAVCFPIWEP
jgi:hypothetical protein